MENRLRALILKGWGYSMGCFAVADYAYLDTWGSHEGYIELPEVAAHIVGAFVPFVVVETLRDGVGVGAVVVVADYKNLHVALDVWKFVDWCFGVVMVWRS